MTKSLIDECDCGYCGKCREQYQHEVDTQSDASYDKPVPKQDEQDIYYWRP